MTIAFTDVVCLEPEENPCNIPKYICADGDFDLGGNNWNRELMDYFKTEFCESTGFDEEFDEDVLEDLWRKTERSKCMLSVMDEAGIVLSVDRMHRAEISISRKEFEEITKDNLKCVTELLERVLNAAAQKGFSVSKILLSGGACKIMQQINSK